jgi:hypothetical protein
MDALGSHMATGGPIEALRENLPSPQSVPADSKRMPFRTDLGLTRDQEDTLVDHALDFIRRIENQMGKKEWSSTGGEHQIAADENTWMGKRERFTARYYNHVADRAKPNTVYQHSNITASLSQRITAQMVARAASYFFGQPDDTDWFAAVPVESGDASDGALADRIKKFSRYKLSRCGVKSRLVQALEFAFVRGEAVKKTVHRDLFQVFERTESILVSEPGGEPVYDAGGDYITHSDAWVEERVEVDPESLTEQALAMAQVVAAPDGNPVAIVGTGRMLLKRDGVTPLPDFPIWEERKVARKRVTFHGPDVQLCHYRDFLCPLDAIGVQPGESPFVAHLYDMPVMDIVALFAGQFEAGDQGVADMRAAYETLHALLDHDARRKSEEGRPRQDWEERDTDSSPNRPLAQLAECWLTFDADGDGQEEEIMLVLDRINKIPIFYEYTSNVTLRGRRPFVVDRPIEIDGRWYGMGSMEYFETEQEFIDKQLNRKNFREGKSGRVTLWRPYNTVEGDRDQSLVLNDGGTYTPKPGVKDDDVVSYIQLPEGGADLMQLINLFTQYMQLKSGVVHAGDQNMSGLPSSDLATGINEIRDSGNELFSMYLARLYTSIQQSVEDILDIVFENLDRKEVFSYFNGVDLELLELTPDDVRDMQLNVRLEITRSKDRETLESGAQADALIGKFYSLPYPLQERLQEFYRNQLKALRVPSPERLISPLAPQEMGIEALTPAQAGQVPGGSHTSPGAAAK